MFNHENMTVIMFIFFIFYRNRIKLLQTISKSSNFIHDIKTF